MVSYKRYTTMKLYLVFQVYLLCCISNSWTQFPAYFRPPMNGNFFGTEFMDVPYMLPARYPYGNSQGPTGREFNMPYYNYDDYPESEECVCSCGQCARPKSCCFQFCMSCNQPNVVLMPYPYPLIISTTMTPTTDPPTSTTTTSTTTTAQSTTLSTTKSEAPKDTPPKEPRKAVNDIDIDDILRPQQTRNVDHKYILTTLRRTKADWKPKYGIVPIPDRLAESLMSHLRHMKEIKK